MWILIILLAISNIVSWYVIIHLIFEIKTQDAILNGLSNIIKCKGEKPC